MDGWLLLASVGAAVAMLALRLGQRSRYLVDYDDGVYWQTALALASGQKPYVDVFIAQPPLYAWLLALPFRVGAAEEAARLMMLGWTALLISACGVIGRKVGGLRTGLVAALVIMLLPPVQRYAFQFGADMPAAALAAWAVATALHARRDSAQRRLLVLVGVLLGTAVLVKLIAIVIVPALVAAAFGRRWTLGWISIGLFTTIVAWLFMLQPLPSAAWQQVVLFHLDASNGASQPLPGGGVITAVIAWCVPFALLAAVGTLVILRNTTPGGRRPVVVMLIWAASGVAFTALYRPIFEHHLLIFVAPGAVVIAAGFSKLTMRSERMTPLVIAVTAAACVVQAIAVPVLPTQKADVILNCLSSLPDGTLLLTDDQELAARAGLRVPSLLADTSRVRINSGYLNADDIIEAAEPVTAALLAPPRRARIVDGAVRAWIEQHFPVRYDADGYQLYVATGFQIAGCPGGLLTATA